jgi:hypothetical protein
MIIFLLSYINYVIFNIIIIQDPEIRYNNKYEFVLGFSKFYWILIYI